MNQRAQTIYTQFTKSIFVCLRAAQLYDFENDAAKRPISEFSRTLTEILELDDQCILEIVDRDFFLNGQIVRTDLYTFSSFQYLVTLFKSFDMGGIALKASPPQEDIYSFFKVLVSFKPNSVESAYQEVIESVPETIGLLPYVEKKSVTQNIDNSVRSKKKRALGNYVKAVQLLKLGSHNIKNGIRKKTLLDAKRAVYDLVDLCVDEGFSFFGLSSIKNYDEYTFNHSVNVCVISISFGKNLGLNKKQIAELGLAAMFHDYGKVEIPLEILNKPGGFDASEWQIMKQHPIASVKCFIQGNNFQLQDLKKMIAAFEHHRNYDCSGYPDTGLNKPMNFYSRVIAVADAYDAMTTNRVYQRAMLATDALQILDKNAGTKFDPVLVKAFIGTVGIFPVGTTVELEDGRLALVTAVSKNPKVLHQPTIKIISTPEKQLLSTGTEIDLSRGDASIHIARCVSPEDYQINVPFYLFGDTLEELK